MYDLLKLSVEYNGVTYWIIGDPLCEDEMREALIDEVLSYQSAPDEYGNFVQAEDVESRILAESIAVGCVYREA